MIIDTIYQDNKGFFDFKSEILEILFLELNQFVNQTSLSKFERVRIECNLTDIFQKLLDICNKNVFSSFKLELVIMDDK